MVVQYQKKVEKSVPRCSQILSRFFKALLLAQKLYSKFFQFCMYSYNPRESVPKVIFGSFQALLNRTPKMWNVRILVSERRVPRTFRLCERDQRTSDAVSSFKGYSASLQRKTCLWPINSKRIAPAFNHGEAWPQSVIPTMKLLKRTSSMAPSYYFENQPLGKRITEVAVSNNISESGGDEIQALSVAIFFSRQF